MNAPDDQHQALRNTYATDPAVQDILWAIESGQKRHIKISLTECKSRDRVLFHLAWLYILADATLRLKLIQEHHDNPAAGHLRVAKTLKLMVRQYTWLEM